MQSIYTSGTSNYAMAGLYAPAGIVNISTSSYNINGQQEPFYKQSDGTIITNSTLTNTSVVQQLLNNRESFQLLTNTSYITNPETSPNQPDNINISIIDGSSVLIIFDHVSNAKYYTIYYSSLSLVTSCTTNKITGLTQNTSYTFTIIATNDLGSSSPYVSLPITPTVPVIVSTIFITPVDNMFNISFKSDSSVTQYTITYGYDSVLNSLTLNSNGNNIINSKVSLVANKNYTFTLTASNSLGSKTSTSYYYF